MWLYNVDFQNAVGVSFEPIMHVLITVKKGNIVVCCTPAVSSLVSVLCVV